MFTTILTRPRRTHTTHTLPMLESMRKYIIRCRLIIQANATHDIFTIKTILMCIVGIPCFPRSRVNVTYSQRTYVGPTPRISSSFSISISLPLFAYLLPFVSLLAHRVHFTAPSIHCTRFFYLLHFLRFSFFTLQLQNIRRSRCG